MQKCVVLNIYCYALHTSKQSLVRPAEPFNTSQIDLMV